MEIRSCSGFRLAIGDRITRHNVPERNRPLAEIGTTQEARAATSDSEKVRGSDGAGDLSLVNGILDSAPRRGGPYEAGLCGA